LIGKIWSLQAGRTETDEQVLKALSDLFRASSEKEEDSALFFKYHRDPEEVKRLFSLDSETLITRLELLTQQLFAEEQRGTGEGKHKEEGETGAGTLWFDSAVAAVTKRSEARNEEYRQVFVSLVDTLTGI